MDAHHHVRRRLEGDGPSNTTYIIVGAAVGFVALLVVVGGVLLCRNERRKAKALTEIEQYVNVAPMPPASQLSPGISATKAPVLALNSTSMELPVGATSPSGFYVMTSPQNGARFGSYQSQSQGQSIGQSAGSHPLADAPFAVAASDDTLSLRSRSNSFEKHESYRRLVLGDNGSSASTTNESASNGESPLWTDPAILAGRIPLEQVEIGALISRGGFGEVLRGLYRNETVAIKRLLPETRRDLRHIEQFLSEIKLMATLEHPRIVRFVGVAWAAPSDLCVATEFMGGGDVRLLLTQFDEVEHRPQGFDTVKATIAHDVAYGLTYLHSFDPVVLHRDLKSKNVLLDSDHHAKLTDFGVSRERSDATMTAGVGTLLWMAPEVMMGDRYDDKADMFSFGVVLSELDTQRLPYEHAKTTETGRTIPDAAILQLVAAGELRVRFSHAASPARAAIARLGEACVDIDPAKRPSAAQALYQLQLALRAFDQERVALATIDSVSSFVF